MKNWISRLVVVVMALALPAAASAQNKVPSERVLEILVKTSILSLNDAILTGNYTVFHAKVSKPFREQFPPEKMQTTFKSFAEKSIDMSPIAAFTPTYEPAPFIDGEGKLIVSGHFPTEPARLLFELKFIPSDGQWKLIGVNVNVKGDKTEPEKKKQ